MKKFIAGLIILFLAFSPAIVNAKPLTYEQTQRAAGRARKQQAKSLKQGQKEVVKKKRRAEKKTKIMQKKAAKRNAQLKRQIEETGM